MGGIQRGAWWVGLLMTVAVTLGAVPGTVLAQNNNQIGTVPGLTDTARRMGIAIDKLCPVLAGRGASNLANDDQRDLLNRCSEMKSNAVTLNGGPSGVGSTLGLGFTQFQDVLLGVTPDEAASQGTSVVEARAFSGPIGARLAAVRGGATGVRVSGIPLDGTTLERSAAWSELIGDASNGAEVLNRLGIFLNGHGSFGSRDSSEREPGFDFHDGGVTLGADYRFTDSFIGGLAFTFVAGHSAFNAGFGETDTRSYGLTGYVTYMAGRFYIDGSGGFAWNTYDTNRNIRYAAAAGATGTAVGLVVDRTAKGDTDGKQYSFNVGTGYDFGFGAFTLTPTLRGEMVYVEVDAYREHGAQGLDLYVSSQDVLSIQMALGGRAAYAISTGFGVFVPQVMAEWRHEFADNSRNIRAKYANDFTNTFLSVPTDDPDRDYFALGAGLSVLFGRGVGAFFNFETALGLKRVTNHQFTAGFRMEF